MGRARQAPIRYEARLGRHRRPSSSRYRLRNPQYTGYNIWNRHDKRQGRPLIRQRDQWVWSAIVAMPDAIPDMRDALAAAEMNELADIFRAFDDCATCNKDTRRLELAATITPQLVAAHENDRHGGRSRDFGIAGAGFEPATFGL